MVGCREMMLNSRLPEVGTELTTAESGRPVGDEFLREAVSPFEVVPQKVYDATGGKARQRSL